MSLREGPNGSRVHERALCESETIGADTRVWAFAHVMPGARVGARCNLGEGVYVEGSVVVGDDVTIKNGVALYDGVTLEDGVFVGPNAVFTNDLRPRSGEFKRAPETFLPTRIARGASIGANATIRCGVVVGEFAMIAAGAVVTRDIEPHALVAGVPAKHLGWVCKCGDRLHVTDTIHCDGCKRRYDAAPAGGLVEVAPAAPVS
jgi:UDP-2-acetamido-3-amino-2,3-dideoxy-glucuronate N-acetyltransferase